MAKLNIFVTVGTALDPFDRLITLADSLIETLGHDVAGICQYGRCSARSRFLENVAFLERGAFGDALDRADLVFTGAGAGTLSACLAKGHTPFVVPRRHDLGECVNDHQFDLAQALAKRGSALDATRDDIVAIFQSAAKDGVRRPQETRSAALPAITFEHRAHYRAIPQIAGKMLLHWMKLSQLRIRG